MGFFRISMDRLAKRSNFYSFQRDNAEKNEKEDERK